MRHTFASRTFSISILFVGIAYVLGLYWWFIDERFPVDEVVVPPFISATPLGEPVVVVSAGSNIYIRWYLDIFRLCRADFQRSLVNLETTEVVTLAMHYGVQPRRVAGEVDFAARIRLPAALEVGRWEYRVKARFYCNPIQPQLRAYPPVPFEITE